MTTLVPRLWNDVTEWFDQSRVTRSDIIRLEDNITDQEYTLRAELPGVDPEQDVQVSVDQGLLTIHAERHEEKHTKDHSEFRYGISERAVRLPANADADHAKAAYDDGILEIRIPLKPEKPTAKRVPIATA